MKMLAQYPDEASPAFPVHYLPIILPSDAVLSETLTLSQNDTKLGLGLTGYGSLHFQAGCRRDLSPQQRNNADYNSGA
jgi:hypothetical protein